MELVTDILWEYGAVNAANLDGGTSASMALQGELINTICNPAIASRGRYLATAWLVKQTDAVLDDTTGTTTGTMASTTDTVSATTENTTTATTQTTTDIQ